MPSLPDTQAAEGTLIREGWGGRGGLGSSSAVRLCESAPLEPGLLPHALVGQDC